MADQVTRPTLLLRIKDPSDQRAWEEFVELYTPMLYGYCLKRGLQEADAADVVQEMMRSIATAIESFDYDRERGKFRSWLFTVAHSKICHYYRRCYRQPQTASSTEMLGMIEAEPDPADEHDWDLGYKKRLFEWAAERVRLRVAPKTWEAFWRVTMEDEPVETVARSLAMAPGAIYVAKSRTLVALKRELAEIAGEDGELDLGLA